MKKLVIHFLFLMVSLPLFAQEKGTLSFFSGEVKVKEKGEIAWQPARLNMEIKTGDEIKTGPNSKAEIKIGNDLIKIDDNTHFVVAELAKKNLFEVALGKTWFRVKKIKGKEIEVRTHTAVIGVRGTIFSVEVSDGTTLVDVLKGIVEVLIKEKSFIVRGGERFKADTNKPPEEMFEQRKLTPEEEKEFGRGLSNLQREGDLRQEIREVKAEFAEERLLALEVKARDFSAGRSMRDVHGNLVRVEQHLYRPTNSSLRFLNINKRDTTKGDVTNFNYLKSEIQFNKELPEDIGKWPEWIANEIEKDENSSAIQPEWMETIISNGTPGDKDADRMRWKSEWDENKGSLGDLRFFIYHGGTKIETEYSKDWKDVDRPFESCESGYLEDEQIKIVNDLNGKEAGRLTVSSYLINNDGNKMTEEGLERMGIFEALKETGLECRIENTGEFTLLNKPIDIIFTADIIIAALKELAGTVTAATIEAK